ncbi:hypothetical protein EML15_06190 [Corynebacterium sp. sy017]|uniref:hypothetical protein n=1 Tax=unclassified Corynebacterium TaxID=2624378 RepID=UPI0011847A11|nr:MULTISPECIES: hypothetical protein [unclassified Corynebacterium]MBP3088739.1 hypothetical protein [Corynebacterium sp. sy017]TSD92021.1 hypothetical protein ELY17_06190 [Corynebacterium sp. SY003]
MLCASSRHEKQLVPMPGTRFLLKLEQTTRLPEHTTTTGIATIHKHLTAQRKQEIYALTHTSLAAAFGLRPAHSLSTKRFSPAIRRLSTTPGPNKILTPGPIGIVSIRFREISPDTFQAYGTVIHIKSQKAYAYLALIKDALFGLQVQQLDIL